MVFEHSLNLPHLCFLYFKEKIQLFTFYVSNHLQKCIPELCHLTNISRQQKMSSVFHHVMKRKVDQSYIRRCLCLH